MSKEVFRKKGKVVNRNDWRVRFVSWAWSFDVTQFVGWCPLFWFTVLTLILSPLLVMGQLVSRAFALIGRGFKACIPKLPEKKQKKRRRKRATIAKRP